MRRLESAHSPNSSAITKAPWGDDLNLGAKEALEAPRSLSPTAQRPSSAAIRSDRK